ncbi:MAG TPA: FliG C-terminal domain-containing protein [Polyangia bacterium]|jgi:flagellar motor switch protein FliG|nr:FliG C-terminal domain-containing protein [Polyangia bacterium]
MKRIINMRIGMGAAAAALATLLSAGSAHAERRPPFGNDAQLLEANVRDEVTRRIAPVLEEMAPGQAELKYVDVRVNRPTALPAGAAPGFEELTPGTEFVAERVEVAVTLDAKLPAQFRKDLKNLLKSKLDMLDVPVEITESVIAFPTPRPQPQQREMPPYGYPPPQPAAQPREQPAPQPVPAALPPPAPAPDSSVHGIPWIVAAALAVLGLLIGALGFALLSALADRRARRNIQQGAAPDRRSEAPAGGAQAAAVDHLPEVRRALREDRVLARRVMGELLRENQIEKVAVAVELIGPGVVEDLRGDPACASALREAAALLVDGRPRSDTREIVDQLHRRILKHRMVGADDPVEQEFAFLLGVSPTRLAAVLDPEPPSVRAAALRYAPAHLRSTYLETRSTGERSALAAAIASPKSLSKEHLLDVAATLRARAIEQAHLDSGQTGDIDLAVELVEERPTDEQAEILDAMRRADPAKARAVEAALITEQSFELVSEEVLGAAVVGVPTEVLARFLRNASETVATRTISTLPRTVAAALEEDLSLVVASTPRETAEARRALFASLRQTLRARGLQAPQMESAKTGTTTATKDKGKMVAL